MKIETTTTLAGDGSGSAPNFAAPDMSAVGNISGSAAWMIGPLAIQAGDGFTIEAWVQPGVTVANASIVGNTGANVFFFGLANGLVTVQFLNLQVVSGQTPVAASTWTHLAVTYDGQTVTLFVDGAPDAVVADSGSLLGNPLTGGNVFIGAGVGADPNDPMDIWGLTIYNFARDADTEGQAPWQDVVPTPGLVANYDFSVAPPRETTAALSLVPMGSAVSQTLAPSIRLDGNAGVVLEPAFSFGTNPFTVSAWVAMDAPAGDLQTVFSVGDIQLGGGVLLGFSQGSPIVFTGTNTISASVSVNPQDWHNVALTRDGGTITLFLDGQPVASQSSVAVADLDSIWTVGFAIIGGQKSNWLTGYFQWLSVWSRALSPDEIVYQQYAEVANDLEIVADCAMDVAPAQDATGNMQVSLGGGAAYSEQRITVTSWQPPAEQLNPPSSADAVAVPAQFAPTPTGGVPEWPFQPFGDAHLAAAIAELEPYLARFDGATSADLRSRVEERTRTAFQMARKHPEAIRQVASWHRDGDEQVFVHHTEEGDVELLRLAADSITPCQQWWMSFLFALLLGLLGLLFIKFRGQVLTEWLQRQVLNNQTVIEALIQGLREQTSFTVTVLLKLLVVLNKVGLLKSFFWFVGYQAGWWALGRAFLFVAGRLLAGSAAAVLLFAAQAAVLVVQLGLQVIGGPNVPGLNASCGNPA